MRLSFSINRYVFILGIVSFLTDVSSEMIFPILPIFLEKFLNASKTEIGLIEGVAIFVASLFKVLSGFISDKIGKRKLLVVLGYSLSAFTKPLFYFVGNWFQVLILRSIERAGKGIRTAPRDAIISAYSPPKISGTSFGLHRAFDTLGAVLGSFFAFLILLFFGENEDTFRSIFLISFIPAVLAVFVLIFFVKEPKIEIETKSFEFNFSLLPRQFYMFLSVHTVFTLFSMNYAFIILKGNETGISIGLIPLAYLLFNVSYAIFSFPVGIISDRLGKIRSIALIYFSFSLVAFLFTFDSQIYGWVGFILYGIFMSGYEVISRAIISDITDEQIKGTAYGIFHTVIGVSSFVSMLIAGFLWDTFGADIPFIVSGVSALILSLSIFVLFRSFQK